MPQDPYLGPPTPGPKGGSRNRSLLDPKNGPKMTKMTQNDKNDIQNRPLGVKIDPLGGQNGGFGPPFGGLWGV
jgi:hypothetical protein